ncbi:hypothetical protein CEXT_525681 [Caerostris extrusa]|uniref:Uncharacterized protein n=1 Tax=Caerostris extrusa TaxID=172846 RepID=A0AAV4MPC8_CAEEX|nr:hypothetical protein CEXT_525681 [Caerostris extrusa]
MKSLPSCEWFVPQSDCSESGPREPDRGGPLYLAERKKVYNFRTSGFYFDKCLYSSTLLFLEVLFKGPLRDFFISCPCLMKILLCDLHKDDSDSKFPQMFTSTSLA